MAAFPAHMLQNLVHWYVAAVWLASTTNGNWIMMQLVAPWSIWSATSSFDARGIRIWTCLKLITEMGSNVISVANFQIWSHVMQRLLASKGSLRHVNFVFLNTEQELHWKGDKYHCFIDIELLSLDTVVYASKWSSFNNKEKVHSFLGDQRAVVRSFQFFSS